jgi:hypothetical protein
MAHEACKKDAQGSRSPRPLPDFQDAARVPQVTDFTKNRHPVVLRRMHQLRAPGRHFKGGRRLGSGCGGPALAWDEG